MLAQREQEAIWRKTVVRILAAVTGVLSGFVVCSALTFFFLAGPRLAELAFSPSIRTECSAIRPGMTWNQTLAFINKRRTPFFETLNHDGLEFDRSLNACVVVFDARSDTVLASHIEARMGGSE